MGRRSRGAVGTPLLLLIVAVLVSACTGSGTETTTTAIASTSTTTVAPDTTTTTTSDTLPPTIDLSPGLMVFGAVPPQPEWEVGNIYFPDGSTDYWDLFEEGAPWDEARSRIGAFKIHSWMARVFFTDEQIVTLTGYLDRHGIPLMVEAEPLTPPTTCQHTESFEGPYELDGARRIKDLGGTIGAVVIEQPYTYGHKNDGPGSCQYPLEQVIDEVVTWVEDMREIFPGVPVGSIEGVWQSPATTPEDMATWLDAYEAAMGEPFAFLHMDVDWRRSDWTEVVRGIEEVADARGVPFGLLYNGTFADTDSDGWIQEAIERVAEYEQAAGGTPDHVVFQSWEDWPDAVLPDSSTSAFTHLVNRYDGTRTALTDPSIDETDGQRIIEGTVTDASTGAGLAGLPVTVSATPMTGMTQDVTITGEVPAGVAEALILLRVNAEDAGPGTLDAEISTITFTEADDDTNLVPNGDISGGSNWEVYNTRGDIRFGTGTGGGSAMILDAEEGQTILIDGGRFPTTPGATYEFTVRMRSTWSPGAPAAGYVGIAFFEGGTEVERRIVRIEPIPFVAGTATTDGGGGYAVTLDSAAPDSAYLVTAHTPGDLTTWPSKVTTIVGG